MVDIDAILKELVERKGSDLHMKVGRPPLMRLQGELLPTEFPPVSREDMDAVILHLLGQERFNRFKQELEFDSAYQIPGLARYRINVLHQMDQPGLVMRTIPYKIPSLDQLGLPPVLKDLVQKPQGMILVTGPTGSGKSTSLAAMIRHINETTNKHIITIEDPIEFVHSDIQCTVNQRQLGSDTKSMVQALRRALRQDPDIILVGEMRDVETMETAMHAAETGHLVFSTLHTNDAKQTVDRIIDSFPPEQGRQIRVMLSLTLEAVISQRLVKRADGTGRACAMEIMVNSPAVKELIELGKTAEISKAMMKAGAYYRMQTFNQALAKLVADNIITDEEALGTSSSPDDLKLLLKGYQHSGFTQQDINRTDTGTKVGVPSGGAPMAGGTTGIKKEEPKPADTAARPKISKGY
jgi:twitching motility protein PilT